MNPCRFVVRSGAFRSNKLGRLFTHSFVMSPQIKTTGCDEVYQVGCVLCSFNSVLSVHEWRLFLSVRGVCVVLTREALTVPAVRPD